MGSKFHLSVVELYFPLSFSNFDTSCNGLLVMVLGFAELLLSSALSAGGASQCVRSCLGLCKSLDVSKTFLERMLSLLFMFLIRRVCVPRTTKTRRCCDKVRAAQLALRPLRGLFVLFKVSFILEVQGLSVEKLPLCL